MNNKDWLLGDAINRQYLIHKECERLRATCKLCIALISNADDVRTTEKVMHEISDLLESALIFSEHPSGAQEKKTEAEIKEEINNLASVGFERGGDFKAWAGMMAYALSWAVGASQIPPSNTFTSSKDLKDINTLTDFRKAIS